MIEDMKILIVGDGAQYFYEYAMRDAFREIGFEKTYVFGYEKYLKGIGIFGGPILGTITYKIQNRFSIGYGIKRLNSELLRQARAFRPDLVFLYRCRAIYPKTIKALKNMGCTIFGYNNDNPFSNYYPNYFWRHYKKGLPYCDLIYVYRKSNIRECMHYGSKRTKILKSYYIKKRNFPILDESLLMHDIPEVVFLGHYEEDERKEYIESLAKTGITVGIQSGWRKKICENNILFLNNTAECYNDMLNATKIAIVFLSKINKDTYTRRCFEIPATKTLMIAPYTDDLALMFQEDEEVVFFRNKKEFVDKVSYYLKNEKAREQIALAGYNRLLKDGHEISDRVKQIVEDYNELKGMQ